MAYATEILTEKVTILNRKEAQTSKWGKDGTGVEWEEACCVHANVAYQKGKRAMSAGALDVYAVKLVRMRWNNIVTARSRIKFDGDIYQILGDTFNANQHAREIQFLMQIINDNK